MNLKNTALTLVVLVTVARSTEVDTVTDCTVKDHLPCKLYIVTGPRACLEQSTLRPLLPHLYIYNESTKRPGQPKEIEPTVFPVNDKNSYKRLPYVNFTITPPSDSSIGNVWGFQIRVISMINKCTAIIADLSNATWKEPDDYSTQIVLGPLSLEENMEYTFDIMSLPNPDRRIAYYSEIPPKEYPERGAACLWTTNVTVNIRNEEKKVEVFFNKAPDDFNFKNYEVDLLDRNRYETDPNSYQTVIVDKGSYNFTNVKPSQYQILVKPYDPDYSTMNVSRCACPDKSLSYCCPCKFSWSRNFNITEVIPESDVTWIAGLVAGIVGGLLLISVVYCVMRRRHHYKIEILRTSSSELQQPMTRSNATPGTPNSGGKLTQSASMGSLGMESVDATVIHFQSQEEGLDKRIVPVKMKLFLAYEEKEDDPYRHLIDSFATYLQSRCCCDVMSVPWTLEAEWVLVELEKANFLVLFDSESAFNRYSNSKTLAQICRVPNGSCILSKLLRDGDFRNNVITVRFAHKDKSRSLRELGYGSHFDLMEEFTAFLCKVHSIPTFEKYDQLRLPKRRMHGVNSFYANDDKERELFECLQAFPGNKNNNNSNKTGTPTKTRSTHDSGFDESDRGQHLDGLDQRDKLTDFYLNTYLDSVSHGVITIPANVGIDPFGPTSQDDDHVFFNSADPEIRQGKSEVATRQQNTPDMGSFEPPDDTDDISMTLSAQMIEVNKNYFRYKDEFFAQ